MEPRRQRSDRRIEQLRPVPQGEERFLDHLLGDLPICGEPARRRVDGVDIPVVERPQRILGTGRDLADEGRIVDALRIPGHRYALTASSVSART